MIAVPLIFFMTGGKKLCRDALKKRGIEVGGKKPTAVGSGTATPATPGTPGAPNGFSFMVPPVEQGLKEAQATLDEMKKSQ